MPHKYPFVSKIKGLGDVDFHKQSEDTYMMIVRVHGQKEGAGPIIKKNSKGNWEVDKGGSFAEYNSIIDSILKRHEEALKNKGKKL